MNKFKKKPVVIEAQVWIKAKKHPKVLPPSDELMSQIDPDAKTCPQCKKPWADHGMIKGLEGDDLVCPGDFIIKGIAGEFYPCKPDIFDKTYSPLFSLNFGEAIEQAKLGKKIARKGWNGKNMFVVYQKGYPNGIEANAQTAEAYGLKEGELFKVRPYLQMRCADGAHQMWLASQSDILEDDWMIVDMEATE